MITLKTLSQATAQEVFDQVAEHLLKQNKMSGFYGSCKYRGPKGLKCAVGCLIADNEYDPKMEGLAWESLVLSNRVKFTPKHMKLIQKLQYIHDDLEGPGSWRNGLKTLAKFEGLEFKF